MQEGITPPAHKLETTYINVSGRAGHEALIRDDKKCEELGLDPYFERMKYFRQYGEWLKPADTVL
jgi:hypothetical protein